MQHRWRQCILLTFTCVSAAGVGCMVSGKPTSMPTLPTKTESAVSVNDRIPGEWLVKVAPEVTVNQLTALYQSLGLLEVRPVAENLFLLRFAPERPTSEAEIRRVGAPGVIFVQPNFLYRALTPR